MNYSNKTVLVTGGCGFIGSNLVRSLVRMGAKVIVVDNLSNDYGANIHNLHGLLNNITLVRADILDYHIIQELLLNVDILFHLAGQSGHRESMERPVHDLENNTLATLSILEIIRNSNLKIRIVYTSTRQLYGSPNYLPVDESHIVDPPDVNGISKYASEQFLSLFYKQYGIEYTVLRLTNTYGPGMRVKDAKQMFLGIWIRKIVEGETFQIFGSGEQIRDFTHVDDCVDALLKCGIESNAVGKVFNIGAREALSLIKLAELMKSLDNSVVYEIVPFPNQSKLIDIGNYYANYEFIKKELGWTPTVDLIDGLQSTLNYYKTNLTYYI